MFAMKNMRVERLHLYRYDYRWLGGTCNLARRQTLMCPICKTGRSIPYDESNRITGEIYTVWLPEPMYQFSYKGTREYIPPRCSDCWIRLEEKRKVHK